MKSFNTGRQYTAEGQLIEWEIADGWVNFYDRSRMIDGRFKEPREAIVNDSLVLKFYDKGWYEPN